MKNTLRELVSALSRSRPDIPFSVEFWDGDRFGTGDGPPAFTLRFRTEEAARSIFRKGSSGFAEAYVDGAIEVEGSFGEVMRLGMDPLVQKMKLPLRTRLAVALAHMRSLNTLKGSRRNIPHHYDRGNDLFRLYLDESLTYSCAYFREPGDRLEEAQAQKYEHICRKLCLKEGETLVDIGCGWGGMLIYGASKHGVRGVGCTLSEQQAELARQRVREAGLEGRVEILLRDYRDMEGTFDKLVSIGMFEHVGKRFIPLFMDKVCSLLKPGGIGLLHTVGKERETPGDAWTMEYIFPGTYIPVLPEVLHGMGERGLVPVDMENLRLHYALTLDKWAERFESSADRIEEMFDQRFVRMWRMYLAGSAAAFRGGDIRVYQILFTMGLNNSLPLTRGGLAG